MAHTFAERLKQAMKEKGIRQVDLIHAAKEHGIKLGKSHVSQYVNGKTVPRAEMLLFLANTLGVEETWLGGQEEQETEGQESKENCQKQEGSNLESLGGKAMREFKKSKKLDHVLYDVRGPVVDEAARMEEAGTQISKLNIGNPAPLGFRTPDEVIRYQKVYFLQEKPLCSMRRLNIFQMWKLGISIREMVSAS